MYQSIKEKFITLADTEKAQQLEGYMRNQFPFYGLQSPQRREVYKDVLKAAKKNKEIDWQLLDEAWNDDHREFQYFVCDYLLNMKKYLNYEDIPKIEKYVRSKEWWDTIDSLMKLFGDLGLRDSRVDQLMLDWSVDPDFWVRRVAIEHQLLRKEKMNTDLLSKIICNNLNSNEFFINKAIGWALRDYSKTNPTWVKNFIEEHRDNLDKLSISEGSKYI
ncbi:DNA alkylation repair protein [Lactobacillus hamsteri]|uniref:DNA alkylation repair protein n=1 Tax=Lactobacillus hamsteri DSM 5661 = JCM 6256 TaxID=1423754 RepID=A0A0R1YEI1_9LACO|nr:DNA alkylation repair protein [Lactobacillus hamsteri]KRM40754.1 DNA alkylation repair protein [Lactobacillus hamsteri DSM 5661 = JCM 6256]